MFHCLRVKGGVEAEVKGSPCLPALTPSSCSKVGPPKAKMPPPCPTGLAASSSLLIPVWKDGEGPRRPVKAPPPCPLVALQHLPQQALADEDRFGSEVASSSGESGNAGNDEPRKDDGICMWEFSDDSDNTKEHMKEYMKEYVALLRQEKRDRRKRKRRAKEAKAAGLSVPPPAARPRGFGGSSEGLVPIWRFPGLQAGSRLVCEQAAP